MICPPCAEAVDSGDPFCKNCARPIVFQVFFCDARLPNPPVWWHPDAGTTCSLPALPEGAESWPTAEPMEGHPPEVCRDHAVQPAGCPCQHKPVRLTKENPSA